VMAGRLVTDLSNRAGVIRCKERTHHELPRRNRLNSAYYFLNDAAILVSHRRRLSNWFNTAVRPQVGPAYARRGNPNNGIRRLDDLRGFALLEAHISRTVKNCSSHGFLRLLQRMM